MVGEDVRATTWPIADVGATVSEITHVSAEDGGASLTPVRMTAMERNS
jgi:hypothetical protein